MKRIAAIIVVLFSSIMNSSSINGDDNQMAGNSEIVNQLVSIVTSILEGKDYSELKKSILPEAYVITGNSYESMFEVLGNPLKKESFIEGKDIHVEFVHLWMPDNEKEAYLVIQTKSTVKTKTYWHSILFRLSDSNDWQIFS